MNPKNEIASDVKNRSRTDTLAHETRKKKLKYMVRDNFEWNLYEIDTRD